MCGSSKSKSHPTIADKQCTTGESIVYKIRALRRACFNKKHSKFFNVMENNTSANVESLVNSSRARSTPYRQFPESPVIGFSLAGAGLKCHPFAR